MFPCALGFASPFCPNLLPSFASAMSSISFPHAAHDHTSAVASTSAPSVEDSGYFNSFEGASGSTFQMNPLSSHPPRTPRTSIMSRGNGQLYGGDIYTPQEELIEQQGELMSDDEDDKEQQAAKRKVRPELVWHEMLKTSYGRDKAFVRLHTRLTPELRCSRPPCA